jgi:LysM repeat protein
LQIILNQKNSNTAMIYSFNLRSGKLKIFCLILLLSLISFSGFSYSIVARDSIGFERRDGKVFVLHKVEPKETLYSLSRRYKASVKDIESANPKVKQGLNIGDVVLIPYSGTVKVVAEKKEDKLTNQEQGKITHKVELSETLFAISRKYNVSVNDIRSWNKLSSNDISAGQELVIFTSSKDAKKEVKNDETVKKADVANPVIEEKKEERVTVTQQNKENESLPAKPGTIFHVVEPAQTLYSISRLYEVSAEDIKKWNNISGNELSVGQKLSIIKSESKSANVAAEKEKFEEYDASMKKIVKAEISSNVKPEEKTSHNFKKVLETGLAEVIEGSADSQKFLALHRNAPIGTIMQVRNEMNNLSVFVRVVGKLPETGVNDKVLIKISKTAFERLNAVDSKFMVEVSYVP